MAAGHTSTWGARSNAWWVKAGDAAAHRLTAAWRRVDSGLLKSVVAVRVVLATVVAFVYAESFVGELVYDDENCLKHGAVTGAAPIWSLLTTDFWGKDLAHIESHRSWRPLTTLLFRLQYGVAGTAPALYHITSVLLYTTVVFLVHHVVQVLNRDRRVALVAALTFAVHPIHVEAVANITNTAELLSGALFLLSLSMYLRFVSRPSTSITCRRLWLPIAVGATATLAKESGITVLAVLVVVDVVVHCPAVRHMVQRHVLQMPLSLPPQPTLAPARREDEAAEAVKHAQAMRKWKETVRGVKASERDVRRTFLGVLRRCGCIAGAIVATMAFRILFLRGSPPAFPRHMNYISHSPSFAVRTMTFAYLPFAHLWMLLFPRSLCHDWSCSSIPLVRSPLDPRLLAALAMYASLAVGIARAALVLWTSAAPRRLLVSPAPTTVTKGSEPVKGKSRRKVNKPKPESNNDDDAALAAVSLVALAIALASYLPASNLFFYVGFILADRVLFLPSIGLVLLLAAALRRSAACDTSSPPASVRLPATRKRAVGLVAIAAVLLLCGYRSMVRVRDWGSEERLNRAAVAVNPGNAKFWYNLAVIELGRGNQAEGVAHHQKAVMLWPNYTDPLLALSTHYYDNNDLDKAFRYAQAITATPVPVGDLGKMIMFGAAYTRLGEITERRGLPAEHLFQKAFSFFARDPHVLERIGNAYVANDTPKRAIQFLDAAFAWQPSVDVADTLTRLYVSQLRYTDAEKMSEASFRLGSHNAMYNKGRILQLMWERQRARGGTVADGERAVAPAEIETAYRTSLQVAPQMHQVHAFLGKFLHLQAAEKNLTGAVVHYRQALARNPGDSLTTNNLAAILLDTHAGLSEAESLFRRATQLEPTSAIAMANLGRTMLYRGRAQEAADYLYAQLQRIDAAGDAWPKAADSSTNAIHKVLALIWATASVRENVDKHCAIGGCITDAVIEEAASVLARQQQQQQ